MAETERLGLRFVVGGERPRLVAERGAPPAAFLERVRAMREPLRDAVRALERLARPPEPAPGVVLGEDGLPSLPCATCGGRHFWAPAHRPAAFGFWCCATCEPPPLLPLRRLSLGSRDEPSGDG
ncbi:MAG TPA: hypothetical protein ENJ38_00320 [Rhodospirillales bacterium]|nr:hypothetical protein [Rhodospirillales bacterium]